MTVTITGGDLTLEEVVRVARSDEPVALAPTAVKRMRKSRAVVERLIERRDPVYGLSTGLGVLKREALASARPGFHDRVIHHHRVAQGPDAPPDVVRATMLRMANHFALGTPGVRPELAERIVEALNAGETPSIRVFGSIGQSDLAANADLGHGLFSGSMALAPGEGLAVVNNSAFSTGWAALAVADLRRLLDWMEVAGALSLEGLRANLTILHPAIGEVRPYPGLQTSLGRLRDLLEGSALWAPGAARSLQDPLTFRNLPQLQGACRDALAFAEDRLAIELNASQGNPIVLIDEDRAISVGNFEILPLATALDLLRIALAPALTSAGERVVKLLETPWSDLPTGLAAEAGPEPGLVYLGIAMQSIVAEARLLAQPVSFEMASSAHAEGIEDRATMAPLAARRLAEMIELGARVVACELIVAAQAVDLRTAFPLGRGTSEAHRAVRECFAFMTEDDPGPADLEPVVDLIKSSG